MKLRTLDALKRIVWESVPVQTKVRRLHGYLMDQLGGQIEKDVEDRFSWVYRFAIQRFRDGAKEHGIWRPDTDTYYHPSMIKEEAADGIVYLMMFFIHIEEMEKRLAGLEAEARKLEDEIRKRKIVLEKHDATA
jgi:hypothetical protein